MASETGATPEQIERAWKRRQQRWSEEGLDALAGSNIIAKQLLGNTASYLVRSDERINPVADLIALCDAADQHLAYLRDGGPTTADQADALSATVDRVRAVIGGAE